MKIPSIKTIIRKIRKATKRDPDKFLNKITGVIHVGANIGQERGHYSKLGLDVLWIEPIPEIFKTLQSNIKNLKKQQAILGLVTDVDDKEYTFNVADNNGASSSILKFKDHKDIWPDVEYTSTIAISSHTLDSLLKKENVNLSNYQALIMDTQGSELLVLKGAIPILKNFQFIKTEVPDFEAYEGCCQLYEMGEFMTAHGFTEFNRVKFATQSKTGSYFDITYKYNDAL